MSSAFDAMKQREEALLCRTYSRYPVSVVRGQGSRLWDVDGREYVDLLAGIAVVGLGHGNAEIADLMAEQARKLVHVSNLFYQNEQLDLAEKLLATCHAGKAFFCNSGAEANEAAIKLARRYQRKVKGRDAWEVITFANCFHGRTLATLAATGKHVDGFEPLPEGFIRIPAGDMAALEAAMGPHTAAVLLESVQGEGGVHVMDAAWVQAVEALCRQRGVLFMMDEIQAGMGRTGKFWGFQHLGVTPDVFTAAKALANGLPLGAMLATDEAARGFDYGSHATTFGGGALITAVGSKVLDIMRRDKLVERAAEVGARALAGFRALAERQPAIREVRGLGLLMGIDLNLSPEQSKAVWQALLERGYILSLTQNTVLRLLPPLTVAEEDLAAFTQALEQTLGDLAKT